MPRGPSRRVGSVRAVTKVVNGQVQVVSRHDFKPFGEEVAPQTPPVDKRLFTGKERDAETGWDYFEARYLANAVGRFTSPDPVAGSLANPQTLNRYAYCLANPLRYRDPSGLLVDWGANDDLRKAYEGRIRGLLSSKNKNDRVRGQELGDSYLRLIASDIVFHVSVKKGETDGGGLDYRGSPGQVYVELRGEGTMPTTQKIAHEFEHGVQFLDGKVGFRLADGKWRSAYSDLVDEGSAFIAGFRAEQAQNNQSPLFRGIQDAINTAKGDPLTPVIDYLYGSDSVYKNRSKAQNWPYVSPNGTFPPWIYALPRRR